ncbi:hypothetical protein ElyMa_005283100 [Elysia marginata]|uniref:Uncharacterized protein n=1 Tax=Elysia marginata TaxID=1093978 RepID=A0AAV4K420_9GAST|nr:hypothetical protein ElyMa_005283100 [Elysia marginata]
MIKTQSFRDKSQALPDPQRRRRRREGRPERINANTTANGCNQCRKKIFTDKNNPVIFKSITQRVKPSMIACTAVVKSKVKATIVSLVWSCSDNAKTKPTKKSRQKALLTCKEGEGKEEGEVTLRRIIATTVLMVIVTVAKRPTSPSSESIDSTNPT